MNKERKPQLKETLLQVKDKYTFMFMDKVTEDRQTANLLSDFIMDLKKIYDICEKRGRF